MLARNWLLYIAFGGWLIALVLLVVPGVGLTQEPKTGAKIPNPASKSTNNNSRADPPQNRASQDASNGKPRPPQAERPINQGERVVPQRGNVDREKAERENAQTENRRENREKRDLKAQRRMALAAEWLLAFSIIGTAIASVGIFFLIRTLNATREATKTAHKEFLATHRPRLTVRFTKAVPLTTGRRPEASVTIANVGQTDATVVAFGADIAARTAGEWKGTGIKPDLVRVDDLLIKSGERHIFDITGRESLTAKDIDNIRAEAWFLCFVGEIRYIDPLGTSRSTGFARVLVPRQNSYVKTTNTVELLEREYQD